MKDPAFYTIKACNCRRKTDCLMDANWLSECLIYKASVNAATNKYYSDTCETLLKNLTIHANHTI